jgi:dCTP deaminase
MILNDKQIAKLCREGMISDFEPALVRQDINGAGVLSFGLGSYGYDIRLSPREFRVFKRLPGAIVDVKRFDSANLEPVELLYDEEEGRAIDPAYFILPAHSYGLGVSFERITMPRDVTGLCIGKSTYARAGIIANITPIEAGWEGYITLEFSNSSDADCRIYAYEGVCQLLFFRGEPCETSYSCRSGKYQNQEDRVTLPRV